MRTLKMKKISEKNSIDVPFNDETIAFENIPDLSNHTKSVDKKTADDLERQANYADRMDKHVYKKHGLKLMIGCGIAYIITVSYTHLTLPTMAVV